MVWAFAGTVLFLLLHRAFEGIVCGSGVAWRRKFWWDMGTAAVLAVGVLAAWIVIAGESALWGRYGGVLMMATPLAAIGIGVFAHLSRLVYDRERNDAETG